MKADLTRFASIEDGVLTCSLHGWQYELATGACLTSDGPPAVCAPDRRRADDADRAGARARDGGGGRASRALGAARAGARPAARR